MKTLRTIAGYTKHDRKRNKEIRERAVVDLVRFARKSDPEQENASKDHLKDLGLLQVQEKEIEMYRYNPHKRVKLTGTASSKWLKQTEFL